MAEYVSEVKHSQYNNDTVFQKLSDLTTFARIKDALSNPQAMEALMNQLPEDKRDPEKMAQAIEKLKELEFTSDTLSLTNSPIGSIILAIVDREAPKCIKFELQGAPLQANMWVQLLPATDGGTFMKVTVRADLNFMMKAMIGSKLKQGVDGIATMLAQLPYSMM